MVSTGLRLDITSWKIIELPLPRMALISRSESCSRSVPWKRTEPAILPGGSGMSRISDIEVTDLPQPDSPTMANVSPSLTWNDTPSTARLIPSGVRKWVCRFCTSSNAIGSQALRHSRIERITQAVAEQIDGEHGDRQERGREEYDVRLDLPQRSALGHDVAPGRNSGRRAGADEGEDGLHDHGAGADVGCLDQHRRHCVRQDATPDDHRRSRAGSCGSVDIGLLAKRQHDAAHQTRNARDFGDGDGKDDVADAGARQRHQRDRKQDRRDRTTPGPRPPGDGGSA